MPRRQLRPLGVAAGLARGPEEQLQVHEVVDDHRKAPVPGLGIVGLNVPALDRADGRIEAGGKRARRLDGHVAGVRVAGELVLPAEAFEDHEAEVVGVRAGLLRLQSRRPALSPLAPDRITGPLIHQPRAASEKTTGPAVRVAQLPTPIRARTAGITVLR